MNHAMTTFLNLLEVLDQTPPDDILHPPLRHLLEMWFKRFETLFFAELAAVGASPECSFTSPAFPYMIRALRTWLGDSLPERPRLLLDAACTLVSDARFSHMYLIQSV